MLFTKLRDRALSLSQLLTKSHAWEPVLRDSFAVRQQMLIGAGSTSTDDPVVDEETAVWLVSTLALFVYPGLVFITIVFRYPQEQMLTPWHKQVGNGFEKELLISRGHSVAEKSPTSSTRGPVSQATSVTVPPVHASQSTVEVNSDAPVDGPGTGKKARRLSAIRVSGSGRFTVVPEPVISAAVENPLIRLLARSDEPDFEVEALEPYTSAQPLLCMVMYYVNTYSIAESLSLDLPTLKRFLIQTEGAYRPLPYHSNLHAADVVTNAMRLLKRSEHPVTLQPLELLAILVSCAGEWIVLKFTAKPRLVDSLGFPLQFTTWITQE